MGRWEFFIHATVVMNQCIARPVLEVKIFLIFVADIPCCNVILGGHPILVKIYSESISLLFVFVIFQVGFNGRLHVKDIFLSNLTLLDDSQHINYMFSHLHNNLFSANLLLV